MTIEEKLSKITAIQEMISKLKSNPEVDSKLTIQKLQQELDNIIKS